MPHHAIAALADLSRSVDLTGLIDTRRQAEMCANCFRKVEAAEIIDCRLERKTGYRPDAGHCHKAPRHLIPAGLSREGSILRFAFDPHAFAHAYQWFDRCRQIRHAGHLEQLGDPRREAVAVDCTDLETVEPQQPPNGV